MSRPACPPASGRVLLLCLLLALLPGCGGRGPARDAGPPPPSPELRAAIEGSLRSLAARDQGDPRVKLDLDRYHALHEMLYRPERRAQAEDSLFRLWRADLRHVLWPDLAAFHWHLFRRPSAFDSMFTRADFPDSTTPHGAYLREWRKLKSAAGGEDFRAGWAARAQLDPFSRAWLTLRMSWQERQQGKADEAARLALSILPEARALGGWRLELEAWLAISRALRVGDHLDDALHAAGMAERLAEAVAGQTGNGWIDLAARRETGPALALYTACVDSALARGLPTFAAVGASYAGIFTAGIGEYEAGLPLYRRSLAILRADRDSLDVPRLLANIARRHLLLGRLDSCRVYLAEAERWIEAWPDPGNRAVFPLIQAEYYAQLGRFDAVDSLLRTAASLQPDFSPIEALAELHLHTIRQGIESGRPERAWRSIARLDSLRGRLGSASADRNELFDLDLATGVFLGRQGLFVRAAEALDRAQTGLERRPDPAREWELWRSRGDLARRRDDPVSAAAAYQRCLVLSEGRGEADRTAESRLLLCAALLDQGSFATARDLLADGRDEAFGGRFRTRLSAALLRGAAEVQAGRFREALLELNDARRMCRPGSPPDLVARIELEAGRAHAALGEPVAARKAYAAAAAIAPEPSRDDASAAGPDLDGSATGPYLDGDLRRDLAEAALALVVGRAGETVRGRPAEAALREVEALLPEWRGSAGTAGELLRPQIVYFAGAGASYRWTAVEGETTLERLPAAPDLRDVLAPVLADLHEPGRPAGSMGPSALAAALGGLPAGWPAESTLIVVPDGPLFAVPWPALPAPPGPGRRPGEEMWIDRGPIVLAGAPRRHGERADVTRPARPTLLALGVDGSEAAGTAGLTRLRHAEEEARDVVALWPSEGATLRTGPAARWSSLRPAELATSDVIHVASHALVYQGAAGRTTLLLAGEGEAPLTSAEIGRLRLRAALVFLSCCQAAEAERRGAGPAHAGLARSFLAAGAATVVAPATRIDDAAARQFSRRFYEHWLAGSDAPQALRRAQLDLRRGDPRWAHPGYWAGYQAIGR